MSRTYSDRVMRFRRGIYGKRPGLTAGCRVLLLRLSDDMSANAIVSIPRSKLAQEFGVAPARITEWIAQAQGLGLLSTVRRGRPGVTAVYQGLVAAPLGTPSRTSDLVRETGHDLVRPRVPESDPAWYARAGSQEVVGNGTSDVCPTLQREAAAKEVPHA